MGHDVGDQLPAEWSRRPQAVVRQTEYRSCRQGGDGLRFAAASHWWRRASERGGAQTHAAVRGAIRARRA